MRPRWFRSFLAALCCSLALGGCATGGIRHGDTAFSQGGKCSSQKSMTLVHPMVGQLRKCILAESLSYRDTALRQIDYRTALAYGYSALAIGGAAALAFDSGRAALKAIGLAGGAAVVLGSDWSPKAVASLYLKGSATLSCLYEKSSPLVALNRSAATRDIVQIQNHLYKGAQHLAAAQKFVGENPGAAHVDVLNISIQAYKAAAKVAQKAIPVAADPPGFLIDVNDSVVRTMIQKMNGSLPSISSQESTVEKYITAAQTAAAAATAKSTANLARNAVAQAKAQVMPQSTEESRKAIQLADQLNLDTSALLHNNVTVYASVNADTNSCLSLLGS